MKTGGCGGTATCVSDRRSPRINQCVATGVFVKVPVMADRIEIDLASPYAGVAAGAEAASCAG